MQISDARILTVAILLIAVALYMKSNTSINIDPVFIPSPTPVAPANPVPELIDNIVLSDYEKAVRLSEQHNKTLVLIFSANWCSHCKNLYKDLRGIEALKKHIVCVIDIDKNKELVDKFEIKKLPTSILFDKNHKEISRKIGYQNKSYIEWLEHSKKD